MTLQVDEKIIQAFHLMWDGFPGAARLINKNYIIIAANQAAIANGHGPGICCAKMPSPTKHRGCKAQKTLNEQKGYVDHPLDNSLRGWVPLAENSELFVHFSLKVPEKDK